MREYKLTQEEGRLQLRDTEGKHVPVIDILKVYPDRHVYAFRGQMGAGKTKLIKALCEEMRVEDVVNSPTFAIVNVYEVPGDLHHEIYHFDCYRLKNLQEAMDLGAEEYLYSGNYCFIEWPEMIEDLLPDDTVNVIISPTTVSSERKLVIE